MQQVISATIKNGEEGKGWSVLSDLTDIVLQTTADNSLSTAFNTVHVLYEALEIKSSVPA